jgi:hypothetical protein
MQQRRVDAESVVGLCLPPQGRRLVQRPLFVVVVDQRKFFDHGYVVVGDTSRGAEFFGRPGLDCVCPVFIQFFFFLILVYFDFFFFVVWMKEGARASSSRRTRSLAAFFCRAFSCSVVGRADWLCRLQEETTRICDRPALTGSTTRRTGISSFNSSTWLITPI